MSRGHDRPVLRPGVTLPVAVLRQGAEGCLKASRRSRPKRQAKSREHPTGRTAGDARRNFQIRLAITPVEIHPGP